jgi:hypothetical protein
VTWNPWSSSSHFCSSMYSRIVFSSTAPTVAQKYPRAHRCWPQYRFRRCENSSCSRRDDRPLMCLYQLRRRQLRRRRHQHMHVIGRHRSPHDPYLPRLADLPDQIPRPLRHLPLSIL